MNLWLPLEKPNTKIMKKPHVRRESAAYPQTKIMKKPIVKKLFFGEKMISLCLILDLSLDVEKHNIHDVEKPTVGDEEN